MPEPLFSTWLLCGLGQGGGRIKGAKREGGLGMRGTHLRWGSLSK